MAVSPNLGDPSTRATYVRAADEVLADVASVASQLGDLPALLNRLADLTLEATGADRVSLFLFDESRRSLRLWSVTGPDGRSDLWDLALEMPMIDVAGSAVRRQVFADGVPVGVPDARRSTLVPPEWAEAFDLGALVAAPLRCGHDDVGLLVVDYRTTRTFPHELLRLIAAIANSCALAVGHAWASAELRERNENLQSLLDASRALSSPASLDDVAEAVAASIERVLHASYLSVHLLDDTRTRYRTLVQRNIRLPAEGRVTDLPRPALRTVLTTWAAAVPPGPVRLPGVRENRGSALVLPLARPADEVFGFVVLGLADDADPTPATVDLAAALAAHVAFAVDRARMDEQVALGAEFARTVLNLYDFNTSEPNGLLAGLRQIVPPTLGFRVHGLRLAPELGGVCVPAASTAQERSLWRQWRRRKTRPDVHQAGADVFAPVWRDGRVVGMLLARSLKGELARHDRELLEALASSLGHAVDRVVMRAAVRTRERELAVAEERAHIAQALRTTVGRLLLAVEQSGRDLATRLADADAARRAAGIVALARTARDELDDTSRSLPALTYDRAGLEATLNEVVGELGGHLDAAADFEVRGEPRTLSIEVEKSLIRIVHETLSRVERNGRASAIAVRLEFRPAEVELVIRDDGTDLATRERGDGALAAHFGLRFLQRRLEALGGDLVIERPSPRGLELRARVPA